ncbi:MAG: hypothetical protein ACTHLY_09970, partial [Pseudolabrys sp.]
MAVIVSEAVGFQNRLGLQKQIGRSRSTSPDLRFVSESNGFITPPAQFWLIMLNQEKPVPHLGVSSYSPP